VYIKDGSTEEYGGREKNSLLEGILLEIERFVPAKLNKINFEPFDYSPQIKNEFKLHLKESPFICDSYGSDIECYSWGWIGNKIESEWNKNEQNEKDKLILFLENLGEDKCSLSHCGWHNCEICGSSYNMNGSLQVLHNGLRYRTPWGVLHYIKDHNYKPPAQAIEALYNGKIICKDAVDVDIIDKYETQIKNKINSEVGKCVKGHLAWLKREQKHNEWKASLTPQQRKLIDEAISGTGDFIPVNKISKKHLV